MRFWTITNKPKLAELLTINNNVNIDLCYDPFIDTEKIDLNVKRIYCLAVKHDYFKNYKFGNGSIVIDPFRYIDNQDSVIVHRVGDSYNK